MTNLASTLYHIQTFEVAVDEARERLEAIEYALANDAKVLSAQQVLEKSEKAFHQTQAEVTDLELEIEGLSQKLKEVEELLYSGKLTNPKELQERQDELESLRRRHQNLENRQRETKHTLEIRQLDYEKATIELEVANLERDQTSTELIQERLMLNEIIQAQLKKRKSELKSVPESILKHYKTLRKAKHGQAIALLQGNSCMTCGIEQPTSDIHRIIRGDELITCIGCGRILAKEAIGQQG